MSGRIFPALSIRAALLLMLISILSTPLYAATVIDVQSMGHATQLLSDGRRARIDLPGEDGYMLADFRSQGVLMVVPGKKQIIDMGAGNDDASAVPGPRVELKPRGKGPVIAGYNTIKYSLVAQGQQCGYVFGSKQALRDRELNQLFAVLKTMLDSQRNALGSFAAFMNVCTLASMDFATHTDIIGLPMRMIDTNGLSLSEIKNIDTNAVVPTAVFEVPKGYKLVAMNGELAQIAESDTPAPRASAPSAGRRHQQRMPPYPYH